MIRAILLVKTDEQSTDSLSNFDGWTVAAVGDSEKLHQQGSEAVLDGSIEAFIIVDPTRRYTKEEPDLLYRVKGGVTRI